MKFINGYTHREGKNPDELERAHERNFENPKLMLDKFGSVFLLKFIYA